MKKSIKTIVFDLGGVLIDLNFQRALDAFAQAGLKDIAHEVQSFSREGIFMDLELGNISTQDFFEAIQKKAGYSLSIEQIAEYWNLILLDIPQEKLELIRELKKHYTVHLLSNTNEPHWEFIRKNCFEKDGYQLSDYFEKVFLSYEMHLAKPDKAIFEQMLAEAQLVPEETLFIDDSEANCHEASKQGVIVHHYQIGEDLKKVLQCYPLSVRHPEQSEGSEKR